MIKIILHKITFILTICLTSICFSSLALSDSILDKVIENKEINIGTREAAPPYAYIDAQGNWTGFSVEMSKAIVDVISKKVGVELNAKLNPVTPKNSYPINSKWN
ncbi:MAG: transporter substrate-binding domain-containing protein [Candidatus Puniceispirillales bacterium]